MFGEFCSCCCLPLLPELACSIHETWPKPVSRPLYTYIEKNYSLGKILSDHPSCTPFPLFKPALHLLRKRSGLLAHILTGGGGAMPP